MTEEKRKRELKKKARREFKRAKKNLRNKPANPAAINEFNAAKKKVSAM